MSTTFQQSITFQQSTTFEQDNEIFQLTNAPDECAFNEEQFEQLWAMRPVEEQVCKMFGKTIVQRRHTDSRQGWWL